jgi:hypothetical protein
VRAEEEPAVATAEESSAPLPPVVATAVEGRQPVVETTAPQVASDPPVGACPSGADVVVVLDEDPALPPPAGDHDVVMTSMLETILAARVSEPSPAAEVAGPSPTAEVPEPSPATGAVETSSAAGAVTVEEIMELETSRYIDLPGVGIVDLDAPELPSKVLEVATERMFAEPTIMETITSVSQALHRYERAGGFAPSAALEAAEAVPKGSAVGTESFAAMFTPGGVPSPAS